MKTIQHNGVPCVEARVHRLATDRSYLTVSGGKLSYDGVDYAESGFIKPQHLYVTTDEEIKEGDLCYDKEAKPGWNGIENISKCLRTDKDGYWNKRCKKIIATTDPKLVHVKQKMPSGEVLSGVFEIPQSFIEEYCKAGGIDEVLVEYESFRKEGEGGFDELGNVVVCSWLERIPKTYPNNCIIIHPIEEKMYSREEVGRKIKEFVMEYAYEWTAEDIEEWIKENL